MGAGAQRFEMSETNPNDAIGGGGCLCNPMKDRDCGGPYAVFPYTETDSNLSPHVVICAPCAVAVVGKIDGEHIKAGEPTVTVDDAELISSEPERHENPVTEDVYPDLDAIDPDAAI